MTKRHPLYLLAGLIALCASTSCNDDSDVISVDGDYNNCAISSFSLSKNDKILNALDSVYFSINMITAEVYNADSLPKGTDISRFVVNVTAPAASSVTITYKSRYTSNDTTTNLTENPGDSINFAGGPAKLTVTSYNGLDKRDYTIRVNVHEMVSDTLYWAQMQKVDFPKSATAQKTVMYGGKTVTLLAGTDGNSYKCTTDDPSAADWTVTAVTLPAGADINTFAATDDALYISCSDGSLYSSADGDTWTSAGVKMHCIYGGYGSTLLGARHDSDGWKHVTYPASTEAAVVADCPVSGTSQLVSYQSKWSSTPMVLMIGGKDSSDRYTGESWAYDGKKWARISSQGIDSLACVTLVPYSTPRLSSDSWVVTEQSALLAMGGVGTKDGALVASNTVYISYDFGITWKKADSYLQFPSTEPNAYPQFYNAQAFVIDYTLTSRNISGTWTDLTVNRLPLWANPIAERSRVSKPVTSWECPYIFLFGGCKADGTLIPSVTRGVINRFTFQPLY